MNTIPREAIVFIGLNDPQGSRLETMSQRRVVGCLSHTIIPLMMAVGRPNIKAPNRKNASPNSSGANCRVLPIASKAARITPQTKLAAAKVATQSTPQRTAARSRLDFDSVTICQLVR